MNRFLLLVLFALVLPSLHAQSNVDRVVKTLDSLSLVSFNNWKVSPDLRTARIAGDPTKPGFDDSRWDNLNVGESIYPDSCWIRKTITLPSTYLGQPIAGPIKFLVSVDDYGYLWVNGESKGRFPWDGEFEITKDAKPGQTFLIVIKAINTGGPLRLLRARLQLENVSGLISSLQDFALSLRVGQKLLSFDTYQTNARKQEDPKIDKSTLDRAEKGRLQQLLQDIASRVDVNALGRGDVTAFNNSLSSARAQLKPIGEYAKQFTLYFDANAHIDAAWLWREKETVEVCRNTFGSVLNMMTIRPDFTYTQSSAAYYEWMKQHAPTVYEGMRQRIADRRWEVVGGMWVEPDCNLPSGESWQRHLLYGKRYFRKEFGVEAKIGWNPDSFGYNWNMPQFYIEAGIDAFVTQKIGWNDTNVFPYRAFWWEGANGARLLTYFPFDYVNEVDDPYRLADWMRQFEANTGFRKMMILFGVGDHGGGPSLEMIDRIERLAKLDVFPAVEYGTMQSYIDWLRTQDLSTLPVWNDELYLEYHQGTYTTQAAIKNWNRRSEVLLTNAEKFSAFATLNGRPYNSARLEEAWRNVMFNQFHDILPGSGIREIYIDATERYRAVEELGSFELHGALDAIVRNVNTSAITKGIPIVVANPLAWVRTDLVEYELPMGDVGEYTIVATNGVEVPSQIIHAGNLKRTILFVARDVPSLGYAAYELRRRLPSTPKSSLVASDHTIENALFRVTVDPQSGWVSSIIDKRNGKEILQGQGNELQILDDRPSAWDAWNIGLTGVKYPSTLRGIDVIEQGPVRSTVRITRDYLKPGTKKDFPTEDFPSTFFTQDVALYDGLDIIDFTTNVDWWEEKTMLKVAFPLTVMDTAATYEIPFGTIRRSTQMRNSWDSAKVEVPAQRWADVSDAGYGVSLLNHSKYGYDIKANVMRLSLLRSPKWPDPTADRGKHSIRYALYPHAGSWKDANTVRRGYEYNNPLIVVAAERHRGRLPSQHSFIQLEPANCILSTVKKSEDGNGWIIQWYESNGVESKARVTLPWVPTRIVLSNVLEEEKSPIPARSNTFVVPTGANSVTTIKVFN